MLDVIKLTQPIVNQYNRLRNNIKLPEQQSTNQVTVDDVMKYITKSTNR